MSRRTPGLSLLVVLAASGCQGPSVSVTPLIPAADRAACAAACQGQGGIRNVEWGASKGRASCRCRNDVGLDASDTTACTALCAPNEGVSLASPPKILCTCANGATVYIDSAIDSASRSTPPPGPEGTLGPDARGRNAGLPAKRRA